MCWPPPLIYVAREVGLLQEGLVKAIGPPSPKTRVLILGQLLGQRAVTLLWLREVSQVTMLHILPHDCFPGKNLRICTPAVVVAIWEWGRLAGEVTWKQTRKVDESSEVCIDFTPTPLY